MKQSDAEFGFKVLYSLRQWRLSHVQALRCPAEMQLLADRHEVLEVVNVHSAPYQFGIKTSGF